MAGKTVDTESLGQAAAALGTYIADVKSNIQKMNDAAQDCSCLLYTSPSPRDTR